MMPPDSAFGGRLIYLQIPTLDRTPKLRISAVLTDNAADLRNDRVTSSYSGLR